MGAAVSITRLDLTAWELRKAASGEKNSAAARRILALALVLDGVDRKTAAETCGMDRQTLRDWVHRYNAAGLAGLRNLKSPGPGSKLTVRQQAELAELVEAGPDPAVHGVVRWRRVDLRDELQRRFGVALHERSVGKILTKLGYRKLSVRPRHPQADEEAQETFKKRMARPVASGFFECAMIGLLQRIRPRTKPRPRWRYARPGPHKHRGVGRRFFDQVSRTPFDCQAISFPPLANTVSSSAPQVRRSAAD